MNKTIIKDVEKDTSNETEESDSTRGKFEEASDGKQKNKSNSGRGSRSRNERRLRGGADTEAGELEEKVQVQIKEEPEPEPEESTSAEFKPEMKSETPSLQQQHQTLASTGDSRVDEMFECALQNLEEAGKALASLGDNLDHELKLFLVELISRTRKWTDRVESKLEWTRRDIGELHEELSSRVAALHEAKQEAVQLKEKLVNAEAASLESPQIHDNLSKTISGNVVQQASRDLTCGGQSVKRDSDSVCGQSHKSVSHDGPCNEDYEQMQSRCLELECEVSVLRKENEKIVKERAEYESAIQRALLKGVSSLNVEALKVLRCAPIANCCPPCPPTTTIEPCTKSRDGSTHRSGKHCKGSRTGSRERTKKRNCDASRGKERKSRKSRDSNMLLLLQQKDAEDFGIQSGTNCCDNNIGSAKKNSMCGGGNCGKYGKSHNTC